MKVFYIILSILFIIFLIILISTNSGYYEYKNNQKTIFTEEKIKEFEKDIKEGKNIKINNYLKDNSKNYSNRLTDIGDGISDLINDSVNFILKGGFKIIEKMIN